MTNIIVISGFLGAGKTTFIKALLSHQKDLSKVAIIENDFGDINLDANMIGEYHLRVETFSSGCICCSLSGDFQLGLRALIKDIHPKLLIIEPSGVGKLSDILSTIDAVQSDLALNLMRVITLVDGSKAEVYLENFSEFFEDQIRYADTIIITREFCSHLPLQPNQSLVYWKGETLSEKIALSYLMPPEKANPISISEIHLLDEAKTHRHHTHSHHKDEHTSDKEEDNPTCHCHHSEEEHTCHCHSNEGEHTYHCHSDEGEHTCHCHHKVDHQALEVFSTLTLKDLPTLSLEQWQKRLTIIENSQELLRCKGVIPTTEGNYVLQYTTHQLSLHPTQIESIGLVMIGTHFDKEAFATYLTKERK